jgi:predicted amidohydrolase YtcJ
MEVFYNGSFLSCEEPNRIFSSLAVEEGRIVHCGDILPERLSLAKRTDLRGRCAVPAFGDSHIHFSSFSLFHAGLDCRDAADFGDLARSIVSYSMVRPRRKILLGFGVSAHSVKEGRLPDRVFLDGVTSRPLMIVKYDGHGAVANSALAAGLPRSVTEARGYREETGWFYQDAFFRLIDHVTRSVSPVEVFENLISGADFMAGKGIGLIHTVEGVGFPLDMDVDVMRFAARGLPQAFRVYFQTMDIGKVLRRRMPRVGGCFATALDGCFGSEDAALREPYTNDETSRGVLYYSQEQVDHFVKRANRAGLQVALHAIGDAAVEQALTAYERALKDFPREDHRHVIIHGCLMDEGQIGRAAAAGIHIALQTPFLHWKLEPVHYLELLLGKRIARLSPLKAMMDAGLVIANGSDAPCTLPDPLYGIWAACNHPDPSQSVSVLDALRMHTIGCARLSFDEKERGTLTEGKIADFAVLDGNPLQMDPADLRRIRVTGLYLRGKPFPVLPSGAPGLLLSGLLGRKF